MSTVTTSTFDDAHRPEPRGEAAVRKLTERLQFARQRQIELRIGIGIGLIFVASAICLAASAGADLVLELPTMWRAVWMISVALLLAVVVTIGWRRWIVKYTLSDTAVDAERLLAQFGQRLRTTLDYEQSVPQPAPASPSLLKRLHVETAKLAEETEWREAVDARPLFGTLLAASAVALGWVAGLSMFPEFRVAAARSVLLPFEYTTVAYSPQSQTIRPGEAVTVKAIVSGRPIALAQLRHRPSGANVEWITVDLLLEDADEERSYDTKVPRLHGDLIVKLENLEQDTEFEVIAGPRPLPPGSIRVLQPLNLEKSEVQITPPAYTVRAAETATTLDLKVLEGSTIAFKLEFNRPPAEAKLLRVQLSSEAKPTASENPQDHAATAGVTELRLMPDVNSMTGTLNDLRKNATYTLFARAADGMSLDPVPVSIRVQMDRAPQVQFVEPPEELVVTPTTEVPMVVQAADDLGLHKVGIMYQIGSGPMETLLEETAQGSSEPFRLSTMLMLEEHQLTYQDAITYYAFAEDLYFGQPRRTTTPLRFIDIRPYKQEFQIVEQEGKPCSGSSVTLEELIHRQRQGLTQAFQSDQQTVQRETTARLSEAQEELLDATNEFAKGMAERGIEIPSLGEAATVMEQAIEALDAMKVPDAVTAEQKALAELIRARENLRKKLNQSSSQTASACRKFDREQRQKLRMPEKKKPDQQQQLAQARKKLEELAKREREWSKEAKQCCNNPSGSPGKPSASKSSGSKDSQSETSENADQQSEQPTPAEVAAAQEKMQAELEEIQKQLGKQSAFGQAARDQAQQAAESMKQGLAELKKDDGDAAAKEGQRSADQLEQLSSHLAAMNARDFGQRLDQAAKQAQQLASRQESLEQQVRAASEAEGKSSGKSDQPATAGTKSKQKQAGTSSIEQHADGDNSSVNRQRTANDLAREEKAMSQQTRLLAELLDRLRRDASAEGSGVRQKLEQVQAENAPHEIAEMMSRTADDLQSERTIAASRGATEARQRLQDLSKSLGAARGEYAQPQLKELMALEEQLAMLQQQMKRLEGRKEGSPSVGQKWQQLEPRLDKMAAADERIAAALRRLREGSAPHPGPLSGVPGREDKETTQSGKAPPLPGSQLKPSPVVESGNQAVPEGFYSWLELGDYSGMREVSKVLQTRIQEAILAGALMDADQPVPPAYKELVEKYYRALSDDLR